MGTAGAGRRSDGLAGGLWGSSRISRLSGCAGFARSACFAGRALRSLRTGKTAAAALVAVGATGSPVGSDWQLLDGVDTRPDILGGSLQLKTMCSTLTKDPPCTGSTRSASGCGHGGRSCRP